MLGISILLLSCQTASDSVADPAPLRRLTMEQIQQSIPTIFPDTSTISATALIGEGETEVPFAPKEPESLGFNNQADRNELTPNQVEYLHRLTLYTADQVLEHSTTLSPCIEVSSDGCALDYFSTALQLAWRRPIVQRESNQLAEILGNANTPFTIRIQQAVQYILESPYFLYVLEQGTETETDGVNTLTSLEMATRLSLLLWNQIPTPELRAIAEEKGLQTAKDIAQTVVWMLSQPESAQGILSFHTQWLDLDRMDARIYDPNELRDLLSNAPSDDDSLGTLLHHELQPAMKAEVLLLILDEIYEQEAEFANLFLRRDAWVSRRTAELYGVDVTAEVELPPIAYLLPQSVRPTHLYAIELPASERSGLVSRLYFNHMTSTPRFPSPTQRGHFINDRLLCEPIDPPPANIAPIESTDISTSQTNRDRYRQHAENPACIGCHEQMDNVGFLFEHYGILGEYRPTDNGNHIDSTGTIPDTDIAGTYRNALEFNSALSVSDTAMNCYVRNWFRFAFGRSETDQDSTTLRALEEGFRASNGDIRELLINLSASDAFRHIERRP